jgi:hypothetical protein
MMERINKAHLGRGCRSSSRRRSSNSGGFGRGSYGPVASPGAGVSALGRDGGLGLSGG